MNVLDLINSARVSGRTRFAFELLPPLKGDNIDTIFDTIERLAPYHPSYINVTYHREEVKLIERPDGLLERRVVRKRPGTVGIAAAITARYGIDVVPHLICGGFSKYDIEDALIDLSFLGVDNILALRGDNLRGELLRRLAVFPAIKARRRAQPNDFAQLPGIPDLRDTRLGIERRSGSVRHRVRKDLLRHRQVVGLADHQLAPLPIQRDISMPQPQHADVAARPHEVGFDVSGSLSAEDVGRRGGETQPRIGHPEPQRIFPVQILPLRVVFRREREVIENAAVRGFRGIRVVEQLGIDTPPELEFHPFFSAVGSPDASDAQQGRNKNGKDSFHASEEIENRMQK